MSNIVSYEQRLNNFDWSIAEQELGYRKGDPINIGWYCSDRICKLGNGSKLAMIWEDYQGNNKHFTYDDIRVFSNTFADFFLKLGLKPGERICIFMPMSFKPRRSKRRTHSPINRRATPSGFTMTKVRSSTLHSSLVRIPASGGLLAEGAPIHHTGERMQRRYMRQARSIAKASFALQVMG